MENGCYNLNVFCSSILGMQLFGCMFCDPSTGLCDRKNFDSLLWATVTVFQVRCIDSDTDLLYHHQLNVDFNPRRLEFSSVCWDGADNSLGCSVLRSSDDIWKLCSLQPLGCDSGRRILQTGRTF